MASPVVCNLYTTQLYSYRANLPMIDITVKSGVGVGRILAPTWSMVMHHKNREKVNPAYRFQDNEYKEIYYELMRKRYKKDKKHFLEIISYKEVVLGCYCHGGYFCHRHLAVDILEKIGLSQGIQVIYQGEI